MIDAQKILKESKRVQVTLYEPEIDSAFVKQFRKKNHLTQAALANIMGVKKKTIEKWEQGVNRISGSSAVLLQLFDSNPMLLRERYHVENIVPKKSPQMDRDKALRDIVAGNGLQDTETRERFDDSDLPVGLRLDKRS